MSPEKSELREIKLLNRRWCISASMSVARGAGFGYNLTRKMSGHMLETDSDRRHSTLQIAAGG
jgi:hypothetical protein